MIVAISKSEKEERANRIKVKKATLGHDPKRWLKTQVMIRDERKYDIEYKRVDLPAVVTGRHKFAYCQQLYTDVHKLMADRQWAPAQQSQGISGVAWLELFILFDTTGARTEQGTHIRDKKAKERAEARASRSKFQARVRAKEDASRKPSLEEEMARFKAIVRQITKRELQKEESEWFKMEARTNLRRLAKLVIDGNQPAIAVHVKMTSEESKVSTRGTCIFKRLGQTQRLRRPFMNI